MFVRAQSSLALATGLLAVTTITCAGAFVVPVPSLVENTGKVIAARRANRAAHSSSFPLPRMAIASPPPSEAISASSPASSSSGRVTAARPPRYADSVISRAPAAERLGAPGNDVGKGDGERRLDGKGPDFEVNLGRVISTLRADYPRIFLDAPSFDIFTDEIELRDPTGVAFRGIRNYRRVFATLRFFRQVLMNDGSTTFRLNYDWSKQQVRVTWNMVLVLKARQRPIYVDGISAYHINSDGNAYRHELETVVVNGTPVEPPFAYAWINLPAWVSGGGSVAMPYPNGIVSAFVDHDTPELGKGLEVGMEELLAAYERNPEVRASFMRALTVLAADAEGTNSDGLMAHKEVVDELPTEAEKAVTKTVRPINEKKQGWFGAQGSLSCETSFDCTGGLVCCDYLLVKVCCSNGIRQPKFGDLVPSLVPIPGQGRNENDQPSKRPPPQNSPGNSW